MFSSGILNALCIPFFVIFTLALHTWLFLLAFAMKGWLAAVLTLCSPVLSWVGWSAFLTRETGTVSNLSLAVAVWFTCLALVWMAMRFEN